MVEWRARCSDVKDIAVTFSGAGKSSLYIKTTEAENDKCIIVESFKTKTDISLQGIYKQSLCQSLQVKYRIDFKAAFIISIG